MSDLADLVAAALDGIDRDETDGGWWETSTGTEFGAARLAEVRRILAPRESTENLLPLFRAAAQDTRGLALTGDEVRLVLAVLESSRPARPTEEALGSIIWHASRDDEGTISATGANVVARALLESDLFDLDHDEALTIARQRIAWLESELEDDHA